MASIRWTGKFSNEWETAGNWKGGSVPGASDTAIVPSGSAVDVGNAPIPPDWANPTGIEVGSVNLASGASLALINGSPYILQNPGDPTQFGAFSSTTFTIDGTATSVIAGTLSVEPGSFLYATGTLKVDGMISLDAASSISQDFSVISILGILQGVDLVGTGSVVMSDSFLNNLIGGGRRFAVTQDVLTNHVTIMGSGFLGDGYLTLINDGTIESTGSVSPLVIDPGAGVMTNNGLVLANGSAGCSSSMRQWSTIPRA
jgi:hypothetical protein